VSFKLLVGDSRERLKSFPDTSIDSIVCDPPYELGFMGKGWDASGIAYDVNLWRECFRVLKPGGHVLAFGGTRTHHRMTCAIEDAGFEIRDELDWLYGSGFPKSLDVAKAIDKAGGESPAQQAQLLRMRRETANLTRAEVAEHIGCTEASVRDWEEGRARATGRAVEYITPSHEYRQALANLLGYSADERQQIGLSATRQGDGTVYGLGHTGQLTTGGKTDAAQRWEGWGTALKPGREPIVLARKPLQGTVASNVLTHDVGALNIDGCRIASNGDHCRGEVKSRNVDLPGATRTKTAAGDVRSGARVCREGFFPWTLACESHPDPFGGV
jgi:transcriptional regulator with XRE-family HTH domain